MNFRSQAIRHSVVKCDPLPSREALASYYKEKYYQEGKGSYDLTYTDDEIQHKIYEADLIVKLFQSFLPENKTKDYRLIELGCGEGFLLNQASKVGFDVLGVDYSSFGIQKFHPQLIDSFQEGNIYDFIEDPSLEGHFDICVIKNVLEHVPDPEYLLSKIRNILTHNGKLVVTVPNDYSKIQKKLLDFELVTESEWFLPPDHLFYFNTENFEPYMKDNGFEVLDMYTSFPVDMFLFNKNSNYHVDKTKGKEAHYSRIKIELLLRDSGYSNALNLYRAMAKCGIGRNLTAIMEKK